MKELCHVTLSLACVVALMPGCAVQRRLGPDTRAADEASIRQADIAWAKAGAAIDFEEIMSYYADDAILLLPNVSKASGKEAIREALRKIYEAPGLAVKWHAVKVEVARSGNMGYVVGTYELTMNDSEGKPATDYGSYVEVWKKQASGEWQCIVDIINSDLPLLVNK